MKQLPCCLGVKVPAATASSLVLKIGSSPRWRAWKDLLCSQSYPDILLTYLTYSSVIRGCVSTEHSQSCRLDQLQSFWEPQPCTRRAVGYGLGAHQSVGMGRTGHVGAAWRAQCRLHAFCSPCGPGVAGDGFIWGQLMLRDFGGKGRGGWVSAQLLHFPTHHLPPSCLVSVCLGGKYLIPGQNCLTSGTTFWDIAQLYLQVSQDANGWGKQPALKSCPS